MAVLLAVWVTLTSGVCWASDTPEPQDVAPSLAEGFTLAPAATRYGLGSGQAGGGGPADLEAYHRGRRLHVAANWMLVGGLAVTAVGLTAFVGGLVTGNNGVSLGGAVLAVGGGLTVTAASFVTNVAVLSATAGASRVLGRPLPRGLAIGGLVCAGGAIVAGAVAGAVPEVSYVGTGLLITAFILPAVQLMHVKRDLRAGGLQVYRLQVAPTSNGLLASGTF